MGVGSGSGMGRGGGSGGGEVKGGWLVNTFLILLTGWQAVLLPWVTLLLRAAGFTPTGVGVVAGVVMVSGSVGVVVSLRWVRGTRSGAVRRLILLLSLVGAVLLQVASVALLQMVGMRGVVSCPASMNSVLLVSNESSGSLAPQTPTTHGLKPSTPIPTTMPVLLPVTPSSNFTTAALTTFTAAPTTTTTTTVSTTSSTTTSEYINDSTTEAQSGVNNSTTSGRPSYNETVSNNRERPQNTTPIPPINRPPERVTHKGSEGHHGGHHSPHKPNQSKHPPTIATAVTQTTTPTVTSTASQDNDDNEEQSDNNDEDNENYDSKTNYDENYDPKTDDDELSFLAPPPLPHSSSFNRQKGINSLRNRVQGTADDGINSLGSLSNWDNPPWEDDILPNDLPMPDETHEFKNKRKPSNMMPTTMKESVRHNNISPFSRMPVANSYSGILSLRPHQDNLPPKEPMPNWWDSPSQMSDHLPIVGHHGRPEPVDNVRPLSNTYGRNRHNTHHKGVNRGRRSLPVKSLKAPRNETETVRTDSGQTKEIIEYHRSRGSDKESRQFMRSESSVVVAIGVAALLVVGGMLGTGIEACVAQLWHCYTHGYDEGGVSQDVLQRTITHTFHLCVYATHRTWSGFTSAAWVILAGVVSVVMCLVGVKMGVYGSLAGMHLALGTAAVLLLLVIPVPYGSIDPPRTRRPLSLYLDDEVLREGVRRLTFHSWVFSAGSLASLSLTFSLWLVQELAPQGWVICGQAGAVAVCVASESVALTAQPRLAKRWGLHGLMGVASLGLTLHYGAMWSGGFVAMVVVAHGGLGLAMALLWVAIKHNSLLLATVSDQERESWASWWCWRSGVGVGAALWGVGVAGAGGMVGPLLQMATLLSATLTTLVGMAAILTRRDFRTRRRVYHTLDLDMASDEDDDEDDEDADEDDWLVKRAKKEGLKL